MKKVKANLFQNAVFKLCSVLNLEPFHIMLSQYQAQLVRNSRPSPGVSYSPLSALVNQRRCKAGCLLGEDFLRVERCDSFLQQSHTGCSLLHLSLTGICAGALRCGKSSRAQLSLYSSTPMQWLQELEVLIHLEQLRGESLEAWLVLLVTLWWVYRVE